MSEYKKVDAENIERTDTETVEKKVIYNIAVLKERKKEIEKELVDIKEALKHE